MEFVDRQCFTACNEYVDNHHEFFVTTYEKYLSQSQGMVKLEKQSYDEQMRERNMGIRIYAMTDDDFVAESVYEFVANDKYERIICGKISHPGPDKTFYFCTMNVTSSELMQTPGINDDPQLINIRSWSPYLRASLLTYATGRYFFKEGYKDGKTYMTLATAKAYREITPFVRRNLNDYNGWVLIPMLNYGAKTQPFNPYVYAWRQFVLMVDPDDGSVSRGLMDGYDDATYDSKTYKFYPRIYFLSTDEKTIFSFSNRLTSASAANDMEVLRFHTLDIDSLLAKESDAFNAVLGDAFYVSENEHFAAMTQDKGWLYVIPPPESRADFAYIICFEATATTAEDPLTQTAAISLLNVTLANGTKRFYSAGIIEVSTTDEGLDLVHALVEGQDDQALYLLTFISNDTRTSFSPYSCIKLQSYTGSPRDSYAPRIIFRDAVDLFYQE